MPVPPSPLPPIRLSGLRCPVVQAPQTGLDASLVVSAAGGLGVMDAGALEEGDLPRLRSAAGLAGVQGDTALIRPWARTGLVVLDGEADPLVFPRADTLAEADALADRKPAGLLVFDPALLAAIAARRPGLALIAAFGAADAEQVAATLAGGAAAVQLRAGLGPDAVLDLLRSFGEAPGPGRRQPPAPEQEARRQREAAALRENLLRRKAHARDRGSDHR